MTTCLVRTDLTGQIIADAGTHVLDWAPGRPAATIKTGDDDTDFFAGWCPPRAAADLMLLGVAVYCADKTARRRDSADAWTRQMDLRLPVADPAAWESAYWPTTLRFLTGDRWTIAPHTSSRHPLPGRPAGVAGAGIEADGVCLFSGGLDSLCGVIDLLEADPDRRLCLFSHHEGGQTSATQQALLDSLVEHYGRDRVQFRRLCLRPAPANAHQARPLPGVHEDTTRSRSLLLLSTALALAASIGPSARVYVPGNGFTSVNVPLTRARVGSYSARTTHPHFMNLFADSAASIDVRNGILNPYRLHTKKDMLAESRNPELLRRLVPLSVSCCHPETARRTARRQGSCGYCYPCLVRRASLAQVGWDDGRYDWNVLTEGGILLRTKRGADLRAVVAGVFTERPDRDVLRNGPIPAGEHAAFRGVWRRGLAELRAWLTKGAEGELADLLKGVRTQPLR